jgi:hypothetical protein
VQQQAGAHRLLRRFTSVRALQINVAGPKGDALLAAAAAHMGPSLRHLWAPLLAASPGSLSRLVNLRGLTLNLGWYTGSSRQLAAALAPLTQLEVVMLDGMPAQARQLEAALGQLPQLRCLALSHSARQRASSAAAAWAACSGLTTLSVSGWVWGVCVWVVFGSWGGAVSGSKGRGSGQDQWCGSLDC